MSTVNKKVNYPYVLSRDHEKVEPICLTSDEED